MLQSPKDGMLVINCGFWTRLRSVLGSGTYVRNKEHAKMAAVCRLVALLMDTPGRIYCLGLCYGIDSQFRIILYKNLGISEQIKKV